MKNTFPKFETSRVKIDNFTSPQSRAIFHQKMALELRRQNTMLQQYCVAGASNQQSFQNHGSRQVLECTSSRRIRLGENGCNSSRDKEVI